LNHAFAATGFAICGTAAIRARNRSERTARYGGNNKERDYRDDGN
jgi:hypothetical protein